MAATTEEQILRNRLGNDQRPLRKLVRRYQMLQRLSGQEDKRGLLEEGLQMFLVELETYETSVLGKQRRIQRMQTFEQRAQFERDLEEVEEGIRVAVEDIERLRVALEGEKREAKMREEYEAIGRRCLEFVTRTESIERKAVLLDEIGSLKEIQRQLVEGISSRQGKLEQVMGGLYGMKDVGGVQMEAEVEVDADVQADEEEGACEEEEEDDDEDGEGEEEGEAAQR